MTFVQSNVNTLSLAASGVSGALSAIASMSVVMRTQLNAMIHGRPRFHGLILFFFFLFFLPPWRWESLWSRSTNWHRILASMSQTYIPCSVGRFAKNCGNVRSSCCRIRANHFVRTPTASCAMTTRPGSTVSVGCGCGLAADDIGSKSVARGWFEMCLLDLCSLRACICENFWKEIFFPRAGRLQK